MNQVALRIPRQQNLLLIIGVFLLIDIDRIRVGAILQRLHKAGHRAGFVGRKQLHQRAKGFFGVIDNIVDNAVNGQSRKQIRTALPWREERIQQAGIAPAAISRFRRVHNAIENIAEQVEQNLPGLDIVVVDIGIGITVNR